MLNFFKTNSTSYPNLTATLENVLRYIFGKKKVKSLQTQNKNIKEMKSKTFMLWTF